MNITTINKDNISAYEPFLTPEIKEAILSGEAVSIGTYDDEADNVATGVLAGEPGGPEAEEAFRIRYLYVDSERRREGIATLLLDYMSQICLQNGMSVFAAGFLDNGNYKDVEAFLDDAGFDKEDEGVTEYTMRLGDVKKLKMFANIDSLKPASQIQSFSEVRRAVLKGFAGELYRKGNTCLNDLLESGELDEDISLVCTEEDKIYAVMAASVDEDGVTVEWAYSDPEKYTLLLPTIKAFAARINKYGDDVEMHITGMTEEAQGLLEGLFKESISKKSKWIMRTLVF